MEIGLCGRYVDVLVIASVLHEDEPRLCTSCRSIVYSILQLGVVTAAVLGYYCIIQLRLGLLTLHRGECDRGGGYSLSATAYEHALWHGEGILCAVIQACILEDG